MQYDKRLKIIGIVTSLVILVIVVVGLSVVGSPSKERARKRDQLRINNLQEIENTIITYWIAKKKLPSQLTDLNDPTRSVVISQDPLTKVPYSYTPIDDTHFRLCAVFEYSGTGVNYRAGDTTWDYHSGQTCFERTIDPDFYQADSQKINSDGTTTPVMPVSPLH